MKLKTILLRLGLVLLVGGSFIVAIGEWLPGCVVTITNRKAQAEHHRTVVAAGEAYRLASSNINFLNTNGHSAAFIEWERDLAAHPGKLEAEVRAAIEESEAKLKAGQVFTNETAAVTGTQQYVLDKQRVVTIQGTDYPATNSGWAIIQERDATLLEVVFANRDKAAPPSGDVIDWTATNVILQFTHEPVMLPKTNGYWQAVFPK